jgi:alpha-galactosidase
MKTFALVVVMAIAVSADAQKFGGLATTPPMGWNSWNRFACTINESLIRETAEALVADVPGHDVLMIRLSRMPEVVEP